MRLTAAFESWHIGDGTYPPLHRGKLVRLSFELLADSWTEVGSASPRFEHRGDGIYGGEGRVIRRYGGRFRPGSIPLAVVEAGDFRFYISGTAARSLKVGRWISFEGALVLDHYVWVEFLSTYPDPPDLFYNLRVRIRRVDIPDRFEARYPGGEKALPTLVRPPDFGSVEEIETMEGQKFDENFFIIDFDGKGLEQADVPNTYGST